MGSVRSDGCDLYHEETGEGVPILLIHPSGATASTCGSGLEDLSRIGRVITYDRRGYARSGGEPVRHVSTHTADAAMLLEQLIEDIAPAKSLIYRDLHDEFGADKIPGFDSVWDTFQTFVRIPGGALLAAAGDVTLILDSKGLILDAAVGPGGDASAKDWIGRAWIDTDVGLG